MPWTINGPSDLGIKSIEFFRKGKKTKFDLVKKFDLVEKFFSNQSQNSTLSKSSLPVFEAKKSPTPKSFWEVMGDAIEHPNLK